MRPSWHTPALVMILVVALALRIAGGMWWQSRLPPGDKFGMPDSQTYWVLAQALAEGKPYQLDANNQVFRTPGYPALLAPLLMWFGPEPPVRWAFFESALLSTAAVAAVYWVGRILFDPNTALVAAAIAAVYPGAISEGSLVLSEAPFVPLMLVSLAVWIFAWRSAPGARRVGLALVAGAVAGCATLMRPSWLLFVPFALVLGLLFCRERSKQLVIGSCAIVGLALAMAPWWVRNYQVTGQFVPTTLQVGASLYDGLNPEADGSSNMDFMRDPAIVVSLVTRQAGADLAKVMFHDWEWELDQELRQEATAWAARNPLRVAKLALIKFRRFWNPWPNEPSLRGIAVRIVVAAGYLPLLACALWGVVRYRRLGMAAALLWLPAVYFTLLHMVFVASIRYREPAMIASIPLVAAIVVERIVPALRARFGNSATFIKV